MTKTKIFIFVFIIIFIKFIFSLNYNNIGYYKKCSNIKFIKSEKKIIFLKENIELKNVEYIFKFPDYDCLVIKTNNKKYTYSYGYDYSLRLEEGWGNLINSKEVGSELLLNYYIFFTLYTKGDN